MMYKRFLVIALLLLSTLLHAQQSDNEDGTYTNPVIWADFPDNDVIRVGDTYYMVTTSMYFFPGVPVLKSRDLVNWEYAANAVPAFKQHPFYDLKGGNRYGKGQWASSIRYHNGKFHILFLTLDEGGFLCTATKAEGPWEIRKLARPYYDAGLFFDDDGRIYIAHGFSKLSITEVDADLAPIGRDSIVFDKVQRPGLEGSHVYKINGYYYIYATYGGGDGYQVCLRSKNIYGPYEEKIVLKDDMNLHGAGVHQGALIETPEGEWWSIIFQDRGGVGRVPTLQPVQWVDGWPMVGENGRAVVTHTKPKTAAVGPVRVLPASDEFNNEHLSIQWSWNHNPDNNAWSLSKRKGYLRLTTGSITANLLQARNSLTQRIFGPFSDATTALDISRMKTGDVAGLAVLQLPYAFIGIKAAVNGKFIVMEQDGHTIDSVAIGKRDTIFFKASVNTITDQAHFSYSFDNKTFTHLGDTLNMKFNLKMFTGNRFTLFNYATIQTGGHVDIDWFRMDTRQGPPNLFKASSRIEAEMYDEIYGARVKAGKDGGEPKEQDVADLTDGAWLRFNQVDFEKGYKNLLLRVAPGKGRISVYADNDSLQPYASVVVATQLAKTYTTVSVPVKNLTGKHRLTFKFTGDTASAPRLNWFSFTGKQQQEYVSSPLLSHIYTADPSAHVFNGKIYIYPSHDTAVATKESDDGDHFQMADYHILSMDSIGGSVTDHGAGLRLQDVPWASKQLWAPDAAFFKDTYYLYFPAKDKQGIFRIGVATSKHAEGPFVAEKEPIAGTYSIDPAVFRDDDGAFYLYFGGIWGGQLQRWDNNRYHAAAKLRTKEEPAILPRIAKLSPGMKSLAQPPVEIKIVDSSGNIFKEKDNDKRFFEAAWMHKYNGKYYFSYSTGDSHNIVYAIGDNPYGPFKYQGVILKPVEGWTNHHSIVQIGDKWYLFYHDTQLSGKTHLRNIKVMEMKYNADGTIQPLSAFTPSAVVTEAPGLKDYYKDYFPIGVAVSAHSLKTDEASLIIRQFNSLTPENALKMSVVHPGEQQYNWRDADSIAAFASRNGMKLRGHTLVWHNQAPKWIFQDANGQQVSKEVLLQRLKEHITTVVKRYKGVIYAWDVANEVISDHKDELYRNSLWYQICGEEFIEKAFQWAHEADPEALLFYNDYNEINEEKRKKIIQLLKSLISKGIPIHGVGLQGHWAINEPPGKQLEETMADFAALGLKLQITELDISVYSKEHEMRQRQSGDSAIAFTAGKEQRQLEQYRLCFDIFRKYRHVLTGVTFWNISDRYSWLDNFPVRGRKDYPLLFDKELHPKKAFWEVVRF